MLKKLAFFAGWLAVICLSLVCSFMLGLWQGWSTPMILLLWVLMLLLAIVLWCTLPTLTLIAKGKKGQRWLGKYRLSRREYILLNHWKSGASVIKRITRKRPRFSWYLLLGERCGKSTLLGCSGLPRFYGHHDDKVITPTRTLNWWFFRDLCLLDLSSNFLNGAATFRQAWSKLARWCAHMPAPAGIIIALPMRELLTKDLSRLHAAARQQRSLIEPLIKRFGERLPLYVMITQCDEFPGFSVWRQQLSDEQRQQALGYTWSTPPHIDGQDETTLHPLFAALHEGFCRARLSMARPAQLSAQEYNIVLDFPESFARLEPTLRYTLAALCEPNAYFSNVALKSVWFSSAELQADNHGRRNSYFVQDLLTRHLPVLSLKREGLRWHQRSFPRKCALSALAVGTVWLAVSAVASAMRLHPGLEALQPDELAAFIASDEQQSSMAWRYLPFQPLLTHQQQHAQSLLAGLPVNLRPAQLTMANYQQRALAAEPVQQRVYILQLADAILTWQQMRQEASLEELSHAAPVITELHPHIYPETLSPLARLALERDYMQRPEGEYWFRAAQRVLENLVNHDLSLHWLQAPAAQFPPLQASAFWPALPDTLSLPGIWTHAGKETMNQWMATIEQATGRREPFFQQTRENWPEQQQQAWRQYVIDVAASLSPRVTSPAARQVLMAIGQNQSPVMQFASHAVNELDMLPSDQTQAWLVTLRELQRLSSIGDSATLLRKTAQFNDQMRQSLASWIRGMSETTPVAGHEQAWLGWQKARDSAVQQAVVQENSGDELTRGLFTRIQEKPEHNPLTDLLPALTILQERISPDNHDAAVAAVWRLYEDDARTLLANALANSACWLNTQWKRGVIWPLGKEAEQRSYEEQQTLSHQLIGEFLRGPAKPMLVVEGNGLDAAEYAGMKMPLNAEFTRLIHRTFTPDAVQDLPERASTKESDQRAALQAKVSALALQQSALEKKVLKTTVASLPATIPESTSVIPVGTQLMLNCQKGDQLLESMNFAEKADFIWQPGQCSGVTLRVKFPDFIATYQLNGDDAWPWFISLFTSGETLLNSDAFSDSAELLNQLGIKQILVRFAVSDIQPLEEVWQNWKANTEQINTLNEQIAVLNDPVAHPQPDGLATQPLSGLPDEIAQCQ